MNTVAATGSTETLDTSVYSVHDCTMDQNCFDGAEAIITQEYGPVPLSEVVGEWVTVSTAEGWRKAEVRAFGVQRVQRVTFAPAAVVRGGGGYRANGRTTRVVDVVVTSDHRWPLATGGETTALAVGDCVMSVVPEADATSLDYEDGLRHGLIFGDGWEMTKPFKNGDRQFAIELHGDKRRCLSYFTAVTYPPSSNGNPICRVRSSRDLKAFPPSYSPDYLAGFLEGWIITDSTPTPQGSSVLYSQHPGSRAWLESYAATAGYVLRGASIDKLMRTNKGERTNPMNRFTLRREPEVWKVTEIEPLDERPVFCAVVPDVHAFALASGLYTGNCTFTFSNPAPSGKNTTFMLILRGAFTPTFPASVDWPDAAAPTYSTPTAYIFTTVDEGTTYLGQSIGKAFA